MSEQVNNRSARFSTGAWLALAAFGHFVCDETEMAALTGELLRVTEETMQPEQVSIWLKQATGTRAAGR